MLGNVIKSNLSIFFNSPAINTIKNSEAWICKVTSLPPFPEHHLYLNFESHE